MASATKKHEHFVNEPMGQKPVNKIPGIGKDHSDKLIKQGFSKVILNYDQHSYTLL